MEGLSLSGAVDSVGRGRKARCVHLNELLPGTCTLNLLARRFFWLKLPLGPLRKCGLLPALTVGGPGDAGVAA